MNKAEMADRLAARTGLNKAAARDAVDSMFAVIDEDLANGEEVRIAEFGTFTARTRAACTGHNPRTGEAISISAIHPIWKPADCYTMTGAMDAAELLPGKPSVAVGLRAGPLPVWIRDCI